MSKVLTEVANPSLAPPSESQTGITPLAVGERRYALFVLTLVYTLSLVDRQIVSILAEPIKLEFGISDTQLGLLTGLAFGLLYCGLGLPLARLADRFNRVWIIGGSVAVWSVFTVLCGKATSFATLLFARMGVGIGEAGATPTSHALIADYVVKEKRASALAFFSTGAPLGTLVGLALGGVIADAYGWRTAFVVAGVPGIVLALIVLFTLKEPRSALSAAQSAAAAKAQLGFLDTLRYLAGKRTFWLMAGGASMKTLIAYGQAPFIASFFLRVHGAEIQQLAAQFNLQPVGFVGIVYGLIVGVMGTLSSMLGGVIADRAAKKDLRGYCVVPAVASLLGVPFLAGVFLAPTAVLAFAMMIPVYGLALLWYGPVYASAQGLVPPQMRATSASIVLFVLNILGLGFGAVAVGALSDMFNTNFGLGLAEGVRWALVLTSLLGLVSVVLFWSARSSIKDDMVS